MAVKVIHVKRKCENKTSIDFVSEAILKEFKDSFHEREVILNEMKEAFVKEKQSIKDGRKELYGELFKNEQPDKDLW